MTQSKENTSKMYFTILIVSLFHISYLPLTIADCTTYSYVNGQDGTILHDNIQFSVQL